MQPISIQLRFKDTQGLEVKGWKKTYYENGNQKRAGIAIHISD